jgi:hypothetical protein
VIRKQGKGSFAQLTDWRMAMGGNYGGELQPLLFDLLFAVKILFAQVLREIMQGSAFMYKI